MSANWNVLLAWSALATGAGILFGRMGAGVVLAAMGLVGLISAAIDEARKP